MNNKAKNAYYLRKYELSLDGYNYRLEKQDGVCKVCGRPPGTRALAVDHDHSHSEVKIEYSKRDGAQYGYKGLIWFGKASYLGMEFGDAGALKSNVARSIRSALKYFSVRGLLCMRCNRGLAHWRDNPELLRAAANYLEQFQHPTGINRPPAQGASNES